MKTKDEKTKPETDRQSQLGNEAEVLIYGYSRAQAIADGVLVDVTKLAREAGFRYPVAMTAAAWKTCVEVPPGIFCQDETGRLWDVLNVLLFAIRKSKGATFELPFRVAVRNENDQLENVELKSVCGPGDDAEPVVTIMLPGED